MKYLIVLCIFISNLTIANDCNLLLENKICVNLNWLEGPHVDAFSTVEITLSDASSGEFLNLDQLKIYPWMVMDGHEHGSMEVLVERISKGKFVVDEIYFFSGMDGIWQLKMDIKNNNFVIFELD